MSIHQGLQQRIKLLQQMQFDYPETANWFDESLAYLTIAEGGNSLEEQKAGTSQTA
ncbi:hypothetical protein [Paenibacillus xylanilyticus]|uniref:Uncharacterized protein n=1 Tax=Paenibacillus xylanilyticus TaxID=248903 RepID=A0A7Y6EVA4_9BACL|nr:hypothetical protein [Paenibacillus xylanilyticus]NUU77992.1 hypothetical protein [Paenibacillus xylanilyticus]